MPDRAVAGQRWEIFCRVIDNLGDIGVCWRLARQLADEQGAQVRLWLDQPEAIQPLWGQALRSVELDGEGRVVMPQAIAARYGGAITILHWSAEHFDRAADCESRAQWPQIVLEGFGCGVPPGYARALAGRAKADPEAAVRWIVLEYLSAEPWVRDFHGRVSPHPKTGSERFFYFPGFDADTGGLLREADLSARRDAFDALARERAWQARGFAAPDAERFVVSIFAYPDAPVAQWIEGLSQATGHAGESAAAAAGSVAVAPTGEVTGKVPEVAAGGPRLAVGHGSSVLAVAPGALSERLHARYPAGRHGALELRYLPYVEQIAFDDILWASDLNIVRGEDSFVRAQWAAKPFIWHIYPQAEEAHRVKLDAFLDRYCEGMSEVLARAVRTLWHGFNRMSPHKGSSIGEESMPGAGGGIVKSGPSSEVGHDDRALPSRSGGAAPAGLPQAIEHWTEWCTHARRWAQTLESQADLASALAQFCQDKLKSQVISSSQDSA